MKNQPSMDERDQFDKLLEAVGKSVEAKPEKGWEEESENKGQIENQNSEKHD